MFNRTPRFMVGVVVIVGCAAVVGPLVSCCMLMMFCYLHLINS